MKNWMFLSLIIILIVASHIIAKENNKDMEQRILLAEERVGIVEDENIELQELVDGYEEEINAYKELTIIYEDLIEMHEELISIYEEKESNIDTYETYELTAYTAGVESTGKTSNHPEYGITASGKKVKENKTIACPKSIDFGTEVYIPYFDNVFVCQDRGSAIKEGHIDIYMPSLVNALEFGRQKLEVKILEEG